MITPLLPEVIKTARHELGVTEDPLGSNSGPRVNEYLESIGLGPGYSWCAAFVYWCYEQASVALNVTNPLVRTGGCMDHWNRTSGIKITHAEALRDPTRIEPGSIFIINEGKGKGHTGIVIRVEDGVIHTIEGNTNPLHSANGFGVFALERKIGGSMVGFIKYGNSG